MKTIFLVLILAAGIYARFVDLAWHFTNYDDLWIVDVIMDAKPVGNLFAVSQQLTNAPFQYIFTHFLLAPGMDYREVLFWGRLPSCIAGIAGLFALLVFYRKQKEERALNGLTSLLLLALSLSDIAYAKQTYSYAIGVTGLIFLLILLLDGFRSDPRRPLTLLRTSFWLGVISTMQYQLWIFIPSFYLVHFLFHWTKTKNDLVLIRRYIFSGLLYFILIFPVWHYFLAEKFMAGTGAPVWTRGLNGEYVYAWDPQGAWFQNIWNSLIFFAGNLCDVFQAHVGFIPESHVLFNKIMSALFLLGVIGFVRMILHPHSEKRFVGLFITLSLFTYFGLVVKGNLNLSPTRQTLVLLPFFCAVVGEGIAALPKLWSKASGRFAFLARYSEMATMGILIFFLSMFVAFFPVFIAERRDPVDEDEIMNVIKEYDVDAFWAHKRVTGARYLNKLRLLMEELEQSDKAEIETIAYLSHYPVTMSLQYCDEIRRAYNYSRVKDHLRSELINKPCKDFKVVYQKVVDTDIQVDFSSKIKEKLFSKTVYFYIVSSKGS